MSGASGEVLIEALLRVSGSPPDTAPTARLLGGAVGEILCELYGLVSRDLPEDARTSAAGLAVFGLMARLLDGQVSSLLERRKVTVASKAWATIRREILRSFPREEAGKIRQDVTRLETDLRESVRTSSSANAIANEIGIIGLALACQFPDRADEASKFDEALGALTTMIRAVSEGMSEQ